jgi:hypothetical protein
VLYPAGGVIEEAPRQSTAGPDGGASQETAPAAGDQANGAARQGADTRLLARARAGLSRIRSGNVSPQGVHPSPNRYAHQPERRHVRIVLAPDQCHFGWGARRNRYCAIHDDVTSDVRRKTVADLIALQGDILVECDREVGPGGIAPPGEASRPTAIS